MGGLSIYNDSIHVNLKILQLTRVIISNTIMRKVVPLNFQWAEPTDLKLESTTETDKASTATFDYSALVLPLGKFVGGFGIIPYSSVGYKLESKVDNNLDYRFRGEEV